MKFVGMFFFLKLGPRKPISAGHHVAYDREVPFELRVQVWGISWVSLLPSNGDHQGLVTLPLDFLQFY